MKVLSLNILEMVIVMTKITMMTAILMAATVVDQMLTPNIVRNVFVMIIIHFKKIHPPQYFLCNKEKSSHSPQIFGQFPFHIRALPTYQ